MILEELVICDVDANHVVFLRSPSDDSSKCCLDLLSIYSIDDIDAEFVFREL